MSDLELSEEEIRLILAIRKCKNMRLIPKEIIERKRKEKAWKKAQEKAKEKAMLEKLYEMKCNDLIGGKVLIKSKTKGLLIDLL